MKEQSTMSTAGVNLHQAPNPALETDQNARFAGDLAAQLGRSARPISVKSPSEHLDELPGSNSMSGFNNKRLWASKHGLSKPKVAL